MCTAAQGVTVARKREVYQARAIIEGLADTHYINAVQSELTNDGEDIGPDTPDDVVRAPSF